MGIRVEGETIGEFLERCVRGEACTDEEIEGAMLRMPPYENGEPIAREHKPYFQRERSEPGALTLTYTLRVMEMPSGKRGELTFDLIITLADRENGSWRLREDGRPPDIFAGIGSDDDKILHMVPAMIQNMIVGVVEALCENRVNETVYVTPEEG